MNYICDFEEEYSLVRGWETEKNAGILQQFLKNSIPWCLGYKFIGYTINVKEEMSVM